MHGIGKRVGPPWTGDESVRVAVLMSAFRICNPTRRGELMGDELVGADRVDVFPRITYLGA